MQKLSLYRWLALGGIAAVMVTLLMTRTTQRTPSATHQNPFTNGVYSTGIIESDQTNGSNINIYPEVSGRVAHIDVKDGALVKKGDVILGIDDSVQRETVARDEATIAVQTANLKNVAQQFSKIRRARNTMPAAVSKNAYDNSLNATKIAKDNVKVAKAQYEADLALLNKYQLRAPVDGKILRIVPATGNYVSPQGTYDTYSQALQPVILIQTESDYLQVRCFLDEILVPNLPDLHTLTAELYVRGKKTNGIPLIFAYVQPFTIPNTQLSDERQERVDVRVLPIIFRFKKPADMPMFPGQLVDISLKG